VLGENTLDRRVNRALFLRGRRPEGDKSTLMVTPQEMRLFALDCLRWSEQTDNGGELMPDLRRKLD
jgi:hypothetical protein